MQTTNRVESLGLALLHLAAKKALAFRVYRIGRDYEFNRHDNASFFSVVVLRLYASVSELPSVKRGRSCKNHHRTIISS